MHLQQSVFGLIRNVLQEVVFKKYKTILTLYILVLILYGVGAVMTQYFKLFATLSGIFTTLYTAIAPCYVFALQNDDVYSLFNGNFWKMFRSVALKTFCMQIFNALMSGLILATLFKIIHIVDGFVISFVLLFLTVIIALFLLAFTSFTIYHTVIENINFVEAVYSAYITLTTHWRLCFKLWLLSMAFFIVNLLIMMLLMFQSMIGAFSNVMNPNVIDNLGGDISIPILIIFIIVIFFISVITNFCMIGICINSINNRYDFIK